MGTYYYDVPHTPSLNQVIEEFRQALEDEIEFVKRKSANEGILLKDGSKIAQIGNIFQYVFTMDSILLLPGDTPANLIVPGRIPLEVFVVSIQGLKISISIPENLGDFIPQAALQTNLTMLMRKLIERINILGLNNPAGERILGISAPKGEVLTEIPKSGLNDEQMKALSSSLGRDTTFIWGPPGTGKTTTIGSICKELFNKQRSVLLVSHTNNAVDQAVLKLAEQLGDQAREGKVIRVGDPKDERLSKEYPELLLDIEVQRRSAELIKRKTPLEEEKKVKTTRLNDIRRILSIVEWLESSKEDILKARSSLSELGPLENAKEELFKKLTLLKKEEVLWQQMLSDAEENQRNLHGAKNEEHQIAALMIKEQDLLMNLDTLKAELCREQQNLETSPKIYPLRKELSYLPPIAEAKLAVNKTLNEVEQCSSLLAATLTQQYQANLTLERSMQTNSFFRLLKGLPKPEEQKNIVSNFKEKTTILEKKLESLKSVLSQQQSRLDRICELEKELKPYSTVLNPDTQILKMRELKAEIEKTLTFLEKIRSSLNYAQGRLDLTINSIKSFELKYSRSSEEVLEEANNALREFNELNKQYDELEKRFYTLRKELESFLKKTVKRLNDWGFSIDIANSSLDTVWIEFDTTLTQIEQKYEFIKEELSIVNCVQLKIEEKEIETILVQIKSQLQEIHNALQEIEKTIIKEAMVIATTLTRSYLNDAIQGRRFDTVLLDEASMAPIPALWIAASLSDKNVIVVGDFKQLPPIVQSKKELTKRWLGRDIFKASGIEDLYMKDNLPDFFIPLKTQYRMRPEISKIINNLFYDGNLIDDHSVHTNKDVMKDWYNSQWEYDAPVLLVDTGTTNAWVTSVMRGGKPSRLNFLSATVCVDIAEKMVKDTSSIDHGESKIFIIDPYRPHATLVNILLKAQGLDSIVRAGTAHSFQGHESEVVIFDLVVDEPHWKANLFIPGADSQLIPLFNVALSRARKRLIIVGDFEYCLKLGKKSFLGLKLLPYLMKHFRTINALEMLPRGLAGRAARSEITSVGGEIEPDVNRLIVTQADFYQNLLSDLNRAKNRIVIYSPFITRARIESLRLHLIAPIERSVKVYIITKTPTERKNLDAPEYEKIERLLKEWGITIIHKLRMHEKIVLIDNDISWIGSLNPLSFSNTQEVMERRFSAIVVNDYVKMLRLDDLLELKEQCPIHGMEMIAAEGADEPFYWKCMKEECGFTLSIGKPFPKDGLLSCPRCSAPLEFGYWGKSPCWKCVSNSHHRLKFFKNHLLLPKMKELIPISERITLLRSLGENQDLIQQELGVLKNLGVTGRKLQATKVFWKEIKKTVISTKRVEAWILLDNKKMTITYVNSYDGKLGEKFDPQKMTYPMPEPLRLARTLSDYEEVEFERCPFAEKI